MIKNINSFFVVCCELTCFHVLIKKQHSDRQIVQKPTAADRNPRPMTADIANKPII